MIRLRNHGLAIATVVSIGLLVIAANLASPQWWLILPGWGTLATCIAIRCAAIPENNPYREAFILMAIPMIFYFGLWNGAIRAFFHLILEPSWHHWYGFLSNRSFLVLIILYFVFVCVLYGKRLGELRNESKASRRLYEETFEEAKELRRVAEAGQPARTGEQVGNFDCLVTERMKRDMEEYGKNKKAPQEMTREELLEETQRLADDNERLTWLLESEYRAQDGDD